MKKSLLLATSLYLAALHSGFAAEENISTVLNKSTWGSSATGGVDTGINTNIINGEATGQNNSSTTIDIQATVAKAVHINIDTPRIDLAFDKLFQTATRTSHCRFFSNCGVALTVTTNNTLEQKDYAGSNVVARIPYSLKVNGVDINAQAKPSLIKEAGKEVTVDVTNSLGSITNTTFDGDTFPIEVTVNNGVAPAGTYTGSFIINITAA